MQFKFLISIQMATHNIDNRYVGIFEFLSPNNLPIEGICQP